MDIATIIGLGFGCIVIVVSILYAGASLLAFWDAPSAIMVFGGAVCSVLICLPLGVFLRVISIAKKCFLNKQENIQGLITQIVSLAETARRDGLLALENRLEEVKTPFLALGIQMAIDGTRPEIIEGVMRTEMDAVDGRHGDGKMVMDQIGKYTPAFGMIGTLVGLIIMLGDMNPETIGTGMAVALLTTLYGAVASNVIFLPMAEKLGYLNGQELLVMEITVRGIMGIQAGDNPRVIEQKLSTFLPPKQRVKKEKAA